MSSCIELAGFNDSISQLQISVLSYKHKVKTDMKSKCTYELHKEITNVEFSICSLNEVMPQVLPLLNLFDFENVKHNGYRSLIKILLACMDEMSSLLPQCSATCAEKLNKHQSLFVDLSMCLFNLTFIFCRLLPVIKAGQNAKSLYADACFEDKFIYLYCHVDFQSFYGYHLGFYLEKHSKKSCKKYNMLKLQLARDMIPHKESRVSQVFTKRSKIKHLLYDKYVYPLNKLVTVYFYDLLWKMIFERKLTNIAKVKINRVDVSYSRSDTFKLDKIPPSVRISMKQELVSIKSLLISSIIRQGMKASSYHSAEPSEHIILHIQSCGFVRSNPYDYEVVLRQWTKKLKMPIVSLFHPVSTEQPYPEAVNYVLLAYRLILERATEFGGIEAGCRIILVGDSTGANLIMSAVINIIRCGYPLPRGIVVAYPFLNMEFNLTPSRVFCCFDPILDINQFVQIAVTYIGEDEFDSTRPSAPTETSKDSSQRLDGFEENQLKRKSINWDLLGDTVFDAKGNLVIKASTFKSNPFDVIWNIKMLKDPLISPMYAEQEVIANMPPITIIVGEFDPLLDDCVEFCKYLKADHVDNVKLIVLEGMTHGFLNFNLLPNNNKGFLTMVDEIEKITKIEYSPIIVKLSPTELKSLASKTTASEDTYRTEDTVRTQDSIRKIVKNKK